MFIKLILSKQLTINKCTLLDCTNTKIRFLITDAHSFGIQTHTNDVSAPWCHLGKCICDSAIQESSLYKMSLGKVPLVKFQTSLKIFTVGASSTSAVVMCCPLLSTGSLVRNSSTDVSLLGPEPIVCYKDVPGLTNKKIHLYDLGPKLTNYVNYIQHKLILTKYCF